MSCRRILRKEGRKEGRVKTAKCGGYVQRADRQLFATIKVRCDFSFFSHHLLPCLVTLQRKYRISVIFGGSLVWRISNWRTLLLAVHRH